MKQTHLLIAAAFILTACSEDPATVSMIGPGGSDETDATINFQSAMQSRATETTTANFTEFYATAIDDNQRNYFTDVRFTKNGSLFTSDPVYYWPQYVGPLSFFGHAPSAAELNASVIINGSVQRLVDYSPAPQIADQKDFISARATATQSGGLPTGVSMTFAHRLVQIEIKARNTNENYTCKVQGVRIGKPLARATFDFNAETWTLGTEKTNYEVTYPDAEKTLEADPVSLMAAPGDNAMLIPQQLVAWTPETDRTNIDQGAYLAVKVNIVTAAGIQIYPAVARGEYDWVAVPIDTDWQAGWKYTYNLDFSIGAGKVDPEKPEPTNPDEDPFQPGYDALGAAIGFTVSVQEWIDETRDIEM